jgi:hypothetical protein
LETIADNTDTWDLEKSKEQCINYGYSYIENISTCRAFNNMGEKYGLDSYFNWCNRNLCLPWINLPKENFVKYVEPIRPPNVMHSYDSSINSVLHVRTIKYDEEACDV